LAAAGYNLRKLLRWLVFSLFLGVIGRLKTVLAIHIAPRNASNRTTLA